MAGKLVQHRRRIVLKLEHKAADHGVERSFEHHFGGVAREEGDVAGRLGLGPCRRGGHRLRGTVHPDDLAAGADELRGQERDLAAAAADVEHAHSRTDPGFLEESPRDRIHQARLGIEATKLLIGVTEHVRTGVVTDVTHAPTLTQPLRNQKSGLIDAVRTRCDSLVAAG